MNIQRNKGRSITEGLPVRFELVSYRVEIFGPYDSMEAAARAAKEKWPDQSQDEDRSGRGWDIQIQGAK